MSEEDVTKDEEAAGVDAPRGVHRRPSKPPEYSLRVVQALDAQRMLAPREWIPGQWTAWFYESLLVYPCPDCGMPALSPCMGPEEDRPCLDKGGRCHSARGAMKAVSQPPHDPTRDHAGPRGYSLLAMQALGFVPYPPGTTYVGHFPAVVGDVTVRSREELARLSGAAVARVVAPVAAAVTADVADESERRGGQTTLGAWSS